MGVWAAPDNAFNSAIMAYVVRCTVYGKGCTVCGAGIHANRIRWIRSEEDIDLEVKISAYKTTSLERLELW